MAVKLNGLHEHALEKDAYVFVGVEPNRTSQQGLQRKREKTEKTYIATVQSPTQLWYLKSCLVTRLEN